jgi:hypothetical protein
LRIAHTSQEKIGQIYVPFINWLLLASVLTLVITFKSSAALAYAFGMAVTGTITITTLLFFYIARYQWRTPLWIVAPGAAVLLTVDLLFFAANLTKGEKWQARHLQCCSRWCRAALGALLTAQPGPVPPVHGPPSHRLKDWTRASCS